jgi:hypothetical protein
MIGKLKGRILGFPKIEDYNHVGWDFAKRI